MTGALLYSRTGRSAATAGAATPIATSPTAASKNPFIVFSPPHSFASVLPKRITPACDPPKRFNPEATIVVLRDDCSLRNATLQVNELYSLSPTRRNPFMGRETACPGIRGTPPTGVRAPIILGTKREHRGTKCYMWITADPAARRTGERIGSA